jgi:hypothetical protein
MPVVNSSIVSAATRAAITARRCNGEAPTRRRSCPLVPHRPEVRLPVQVADVLAVQAGHQPNRACLVWRCGEMLGSGSADPEDVGPFLLLVSCWAPSARHTRWRGNRRVGRRVALGAGVPLSSGW